MLIIRNLTTKLLFSILFISSVNLSFAQSFKTPNGGVDGSTGGNHEETQITIDDGGDNVPVGIGSNYTGNSPGGSKALELTTSDGSSQATRFLIRGGSANKDFEFYRGNAGNEEEIMRIKGENGRVGIGVKNPYTKLHIRRDKNPQFSIQWYKNNNGTLTSTRTTMGVMSCSGCASAFADAGDFVLRHELGTDAQDIIFKAFNDNNGGIKFTTGNSSTGEKMRMMIKNNGKVGIGTSNTSNGNYRLYVKDGVRTEKVLCDLPGNWSDYVFDDDYKLKSLKQVKTYINQNGHLEDIPSAQEVKNNGIDLGKMDAKLLKKIEELTLYSIEQQEKIEALKEKNKALQEIKSDIAKIKARNKQLAEQVKQIRSSK